MVEYTLGKKERLNSKTLIERLFSGGSKSFPAFPLRVVYMLSLIHISEPTRRS